MILKFELTSSTSSIVSSNNQNLHLLENLNGSSYTSVTMTFYFAAIPFLCHSLVATELLLELLPRVVALVHLRHKLSK